MAKNSMEAIKSIFKFLVQEKGFDSVYKNVMSDNL